MASTPGTFPGSAPNKILTILGDQPIGTAQSAQNGETMNVYPQMSFVQMLQRIVSYIGQPGTNSTGSSLSSQVSTVQEFVNNSGPVLQTSLNDAQTLAYFGALDMPTLQSFVAAPVYAPLVNGDAPGAILPGYPVGMVKGPTFMADPYGQAIMVQIR